jgi:hypothetical protein
MRSQVLPDFGYEANQQMEDIALTRRSP